MQLNPTHADHAQTGLQSHLRRFCMRAMVLFFAAWLVAGWSPLCGADEAETLVKRGMEAASQGPAEEAVRLLSLAIESKPEVAFWYYLRGRERFRLGQIREAVVDFDRHVALRPSSEAQQWERGIALYYASEFDRGAKQFELYQSFHNADVENGAWHFLCQAQTVGMAKAREKLLAIRPDARVPMKEILDLYAGRAEAAAVFAAAEAGKPGADELKRRLFYAHLYVGLFLEVKGEAEESKRHILKASELRIDHFMGDVARVHAERLAGVKSKP